MVKRTEPFQPGGPIDGDGSGEDGWPIGCLFCRLLSAPLCTWALPLTAASCSWLWCLDYRETCSCHSVQLVLWMSFVLSTWLCPIFISMLAPGQLAGSWGKKGGHTQALGTLQDNSAREDESLKPGTVRLWRCCFQCSEDRVSTNTRLQIKLMYWQ